MIEERVLRGGHYAAELEEPEVYRARRDALCDRLDENALAVLFGATDDRGYGDVGTFRQEPSFFYLTGVELPNAVLVLARAHETLFLPARNPAIEAWTGPKFGPGEESSTAFGFERVLDRDASEVVVDARRRPVPSFIERVASSLADGADLWLALPPFAAAAPLILEHQFLQRLRERLPSFTVRDLSPLLAELRLRKDAGEVGLIRKAVEATAAAMRAAAAAVHPGSTEGEVEGAAYAALRRHGAEGWAFPPIVGSGMAGCVLHYDANRGTLAEGELVVVDIGARWGYYCGDLTRTFPVGGKFDARQRKLYGAVVAAYDAAVKAVRPGVSITEVRGAAYDALENSGVKGPDGLSLGSFFIHGIGHFLGLETHDVGGEGPLLEPGMVLTIEPGVYLPEEGVGIRVEDDYLVTAAGAECLSAPLPRDVAGVERMMRRRRA
jgi:Xaa-Pro aminopeptidase